jgi:hypothetical protein
MTKEKKFYNIDTNRFLMRPLLQNRLCKAMFIVLKNRFFKGIQSYKILRKIANYGPSISLLPAIEKLANFQGDQIGQLFTKWAALEDLLHFCETVATFQSSNCFAFLPTFKHGFVAGIKVLKLI